MLKCRIRSKPIGKLTFLDTCWRPNLVQFGAGNSHLNWFCLGSILAEATPSIFSKLWCFCRKFKYNGDVWNTLFISSGSFSKIRPGGTKPMFGAQQITAKPVVLDRKRHQVRICGLLAKNSRYLAFATKKILKTPRIMLPCSQQKLERTALRRRKMSGFNGFWWKGFFSLGLMCNCKVFGTSVSNRNNGKILGFSHSRSVLGNAILRAPVIFYFFIELLSWGFP